MKTKKCKCKTSQPTRIGNCEVCRKCKGIIIKIRKTFYRRTKIKVSKKKYNRKTIKKQTRKEIENVK